MKALGHRHSGGHAGHTASGHLVWAQVSASFDLVVYPRRWQATIGQLSGAGYVGPVGGAHDVLWLARYSLVSGMGGLATTMQVFFAVAEGLWLTLKG
jgi:hypothetical protein